MELLRKYWYAIYILILLTIGVTITVPSLDNKERPVDISTPFVDSLDFYSANIPYESQLFIHSWLNRNGVSDLSVKNITVQPGEYNDSVYRRGTLMFKQVTMYIDIKNPNVSYRIHIEDNPENSTGAVVFISCPDKPHQKGSDALCQETVKV